MNNNVDGMDDICLVTHGNPHRLVDCIISPAELNFLEIRQFHDGEDFAT